MRVQGGTNLYGFSVGILMLDTRFPRIPGDMGNARPSTSRCATIACAGASPHRVVRQGQRELLPAFVEGARFLEREGSGRSPPTAASWPSSSQSSRRSVSVPVFTSSLMLVPLVQRMLPPGRAVGVLTVNAASLHREHMAGAGIAADAPVVVAGLETEKEFTRVLLDDQLILDVEAARQEHLTVAGRLVAEHPEIGAIVLECTNMPPYRADIQAATGLPVFDITTLVRMVHDSVCHGLAPRPA